MNPLTFFVPSDFKEEIMSHIGKILKTLRNLSKLSQKELSELSGIKQSHISHLENGNCQPTLDSLSKFSSIFGVPPHIIIYLGLKSENIDAVWGDLDENSQMQINKHLELTSELYLKRLVEKGQQHLISRAMSATNISDDSKQVMAELLPNMS